MEGKDLRFIVFVLNSKVEYHDGKVFVSLKDAREFVRDTMEVKYGDKAVIGTFVDDGSQEMNIEFIETIGLKTSKKVSQLNLFKALGA
jgi:hypothetical protein